MKLYDHPKYYEIAFSYRNIQSELDFFEYLINKYSKIVVKEVLELASGTSPYLEEWNKRGYRYTGLDLNPEMVNYVKTKAKERDIKARLLKDNLITFIINDYNADLVYTLLGSLYVKSDKELFEHLNSVDFVLVKGGLYVLGEVVTPSMVDRKSDQWTISKKGIIVTTTYKAKGVNRKKQLQIEDLKLNINDNGEKKIITSQILQKYFQPEELKSLIKMHGKFETVGEYSNFSTQKMPEREERPILVLRKL